MAALSFVSATGSDLQATFPENPLPSNQANCSVSHMTITAGANTSIGDHLCRVRVHHDLILGDDLTFVVSVKRAVQIPMPIV